MTTVYWLTCRSMKDLCSTTHQALLTGLVNRDCRVVLVNADESVSHQQAPWDHVRVSSSSLPGQAARSIGKKMKTWAKSHTFEMDAVVVLDWRVAPRLAPLFSSLEIAWALLDRSPPANAGLLARLQWPSWKSAWRLVSAHPNGLGFAVSPSHSRLVEQKTGTPFDKMVVLPVGVDLDMFRPGKRRSRFTLIYQGRLDKNRGVLALPMLVEKARQTALEVDLILVGEGDAVGGLKQIQEGMDGLELYPSMPQNELAVLLSTCHVGLLPMPNNPVWSVASPLKQVEYAASGLAMLGIDHQGHRLRNECQTSWLKLVSQEDFLRDGVRWLVELDEKSLEEVGAAARCFAEEELSWNAPIGALHEALLTLIPTSR